MLNDMKPERQALLKSNLVNGYFLILVGIRLRKSLCYRVAKRVVPVDFNIAGRLEERLDFAQVKNAVLVKIRHTEKIFGVVDVGIFCTCRLMMDFASTPAAQCLFAIARLSPRLFASTPLAG